MKPNKKRKWVKSAIEMIVGLSCALALGAVFYGAMAYQLSGEQAPETAAAVSADALLTLPGAKMRFEQTVLQEMGGETCTVTIRRYYTDGGVEIEAVSASPAAYIERLARENWTAQLVTGFSLAGLEAVYSVRGEEGMLSSRKGDRIYMLRAAADERTLYTLGTSACLE